MMVDFVNEDSSSGGRPGLTFQRSPGTPFSLPPLEILVASLGGDIELVEPVPNALQTPILRWLGSLGRKRGGQDYREAWASGDDPIGGCRIPCDGSRQELPRDDSAPGTCDNVDRPLLRGSLVRALSTGWRTATPRQAPQEHRRRVSQPILVRVALHEKGIPKHRPGCINRAAQSSSPLTVRARTWRTQRRQRKDWLMSDVSAPFIRLGDDGDDAPRLSYSIPESTNHVGLSVICVDVDQGDLNAETLARVRANADAKNPGGRPRPIPPDLTVTGLTVVPKGPRMATVNSVAAVAKFYEQNQTNFIYAPSEGMLGFSGDFDIILPRPNPPEQVFPKILFFEKLRSPISSATTARGGSSRRSSCSPARSQDFARATRRSSRPTRPRSTSAPRCSIP